MKGNRVVLSISSVTKSDDHQYYVKFPWVRYDFLIVSTWGCIDVGREYQIIQFVNCYLGFKEKRASDIVRTHKKIIFTFYCRR